MKKTSVATAKTAPKQSDTYKLTEDHGSGIGTVESGTVVDITLVNTKPVPGVGGHEGVLFSWIEADSMRSAHLPMGEFTRLFKKVGK